MRRRLALLVLSVTAMVTIAFLLPLAVVVRVVARDRALSAADQESRTLAGLLSAITMPADVEPVVVQLNAGSPRAAAVFLADGTRVGADVDLPSAELELARTGRAFTSSSDGERRIIVPVRNTDGTVTVTVVAVPDRLLREGVTSAWIVLGGVGLMLVLFGVALADRLARSMVVAIEDLQSGTQRLERGELSARIDPSGPPEIAAVGRTVNALADRIDDLLSAEREAVADLSHRLRTPLAALQLEADAVEPEARRELLQDRIDRVTGELTAVITEMRRPRDRGVAATSDLDAVVRNRLDFWAVLAEDQSRSWTYDGPNAPAIVPLPVEEVAAAVDAVLGNVFAHTADGTDFRVRVLDGRDLALVVEDDGPGLPTGAEVRGASGGDSTGLGLDIVRRTAERSGGTLTIDRAPSGGARVEAHFGGPDPPALRTAASRSPGAILRPEEPDDPYDPDQLPSPSRRRPSSRSRGSRHRRPTARGAHRRSATRARDDRTRPRWHTPRARAPGRRRPPGAGSRRSATR
jgi:signal transduction histidine kinase